VHIRQSTPDQVQHNLESQRRQYALVDRARALGWQDIEVIDDDLGISGSGTHRPGFERLLRALCDGQVGAVFSIEASRLARNGRDWHTLLDFCSVVGALLIDAEAVYDPRLTNDRLLLGMKGTTSEMEVASFRERAQAALVQKAQRGALVRRVPIGYVKGSDDRIEKDPDARVTSTIDLIFRKFAELGSVRQVYFWFDQQHIELPVARGPEEVREVVWQAARYHTVLSVMKNPVYAGAYAYGRSKTVMRLDAGEKRVRRPVQRRREDWAVLILDHHDGYIDWDVYHLDPAHSCPRRGHRTPYRRAPNACLWIPRIPNLWLGIREMRFSRQSDGIACIHGGPTDLDCAYFLFTFEQVLRHSRSSGRKPPRPQSSEPTFRCCS